MIQNMQTSYLKFKKIINEINQDYEKVKKESFGESNWKDKGKDINSNIINFQKYFDDLTKKVNYIKENALEATYQSTLEQIEPALEKAKNVTVPQIQAINEKTRYFESNFELSSTEGDNNEMSQQQEQISDLVHNQEILDARRKELEGIHQTAAMLKDTTDKMAQDVHQQGVMLDDIEHNVEVAEENAIKAKKEITKADEISRGNRKRMCCFIIIIAVAIGAITAILLSLIL